MGLEWLNEIEYRDLLDGDVALIADYCGMDTLIKLWEELPSMNLFISTKPVVEAKRRYIEKHYDGHNTKKLAKVLNCSERFVYDVASKGANRMQNNEQSNGGNTG